MKDACQKKPWNAKAKKPALDHVLVEHCLNMIYMELEVTKANNGGTLPYGAIPRL